MSKWLIGLVLVAAFLHGVHASAKFFRFSAGSAQTVDSSPFGAAVAASSYPASNSYTVAFWLKVTSDIAGVIYADGDGASTRGFSIVHKANVNGTHTLAACVGNSGVAANCADLGSPIIHAEWVHVAVTFEWSGAVDTIIRYAVSQGPLYASNFATASVAFQLNPQAGDSWYLNRDGASSFDMGHLFVVFGSVNIEEVIGMQRGIVPDRSNSYRGGYFDFAEDGTFTTITSSWTDVNMRLVAGGTGQSFEQWDCGNGNLERWEQCDVTSGLCSNCVCATAEGVFPKSPLSSGTGRECVIPRGLNNANLTLELHNTQLAIGLPVYPPNGKFSTNTGSGLTIALWFKVVSTNTSGFIWSVGDGTSRGFGLWLEWIDDARYELRWARPGFGFEPQTFIRANGYNFLHVLPFEDFSFVAVTLRNDDATVSNNMTRTLYAEGFGGQPYQEASTLAGDNTWYAEADNDLVGLPLDIYNDKIVFGSVAGPKLNIIRPTVWRGALDMDAVGESRRGFLGRAYDDDPSKFRALPYTVFAASTDGGSVLINRVDEAIVLGFVASHNATEMCTGSGLNDYEQCDASITTGCTGCACSGAYGQPLPADGGCILIPSVTASSASLGSPVASLTIAGTNFGTNTADVVVDLRPTGTCAVTSTTQTAIGCTTSGISIGELTAQIAVRGVVSPGFIQVANVVAGITVDSKPSSITVANTQSIIISGTNMGTSIAELSVVLSVTTSGTVKIGCTVTAANGVSVTCTPTSRLIPVTATLGGTLAVAATRFGVTASAPLGSIVLEPVTTSSNIIRASDGDCPMTINGDRFGTVTGDVTVTLNGNVNCPVSSVSATKVECAPPLGLAVGPLTAVVTRLGGSSASRTVGSVIANPHIVSVKPNKIAAAVGLDPAVNQAFNIKVAGLDETLATVRVNVSWPGVNSLLDPNFYTIGDKTVNTTTLGTGFRKGNSSIGEVGYFTLTSYCYTAAPFLIGPITDAPLPAGLQLPGSTAIVDRVSRIGSSIIIAGSNFGSSVGSVQIKIYTIYHNEANPMDWDAEVVANPGNFFTITPVSISGWTSNNFTASFTWPTDAQIQVSGPSDEAARQMIVEVKNQGGTSSGWINIADTVGAPAITRSEAKLSAGAGQVTITGSGFAGLNTLNSVELYKGSDSTAIPCATVPSEADVVVCTFSTSAFTNYVGPLNAKVTSYGSSSVVEQVATIFPQHTVTFPSPRLTLSANVATLTIDGTGFIPDPNEQDNIIEVGGPAACTTVKATSTQLTCEILSPPTDVGAVLTIAVKIYGGYNTGGAKEYAKIVAAPTITGLPGGSGVFTLNKQEAVQIIVQGTGFNPDLAGNIVEVFPFGQTWSLVSVTSTQLVLNFPSGFTGNADTELRIRVTSYGGYNDGGFITLANLVMPVPPPTDLPPGGLPPNLLPPTQAPFDVIFPPDDGVQGGNPAVGIAIGIVVAVLVIAAVIGLMVWLYKTGRIFAKRVENPDADDNTAQDDENAMPMDDADPWADKN